MDPKKLEAAILQISKTSQADIPLLLGCAVFRKLKKGEVLLKEGEVCRSFYLVEHGYLRTWYNKNGVPINLNFTFEGEGISNLKSVKSRNPSEVIIEAGECTGIWVFDLDAMSEYYKSHPAITVFVRRLAVQVLMASEEHSRLF